MNAFEEYWFGDDYVLRFYRVDHGLVCTINESMVSGLRELETKISQQADRIAELEKELCACGKPLAPNTVHRKDDPCYVAEPVAYVNSMCNDYIDWKVEPTIIDGKPLYTTPQTRDEE